MHTLYNRLSFISFFLCALIFIHNITSCDLLFEDKSLSELCQPYNSSIFQIQSFKGQGTFGEVNLVKFRNNPNSPIFALKKVFIADDVIRKDVTEEIKAGFCFKSEPLLLGIHNCFYQELPNKKSQVYILQTALDEDLDKVAMNNRLNPFLQTNQINFKLFVMFVVTQSLDRLHNLHMVHRDIKPENIMVIFRENRAFFIDYGMLDYSDSNSFSGLSGTPQFMAPEISQASYTNAVDIYSLGITFYLFLRNMSESIYYSTDERKFSMFDFTGIEKFKSLLINMTFEDPSKRPSARDVLLALRSIIQNKEPDNLKDGDVQFIMTNTEYCENLKKANLKLRNKAVETGNLGTVEMYEDRTPSGQSCADYKKGLIEKLQKKQIQDFEDSFKKDLLKNQIKEKLKSTFSGIKKNPLDQNSNAIMAPKLFRLI